MGQRLAAVKKKKKTPFFIASRNLHSNSENIKKHLRNIRNIKKHYLRIYKHLYVTDDNYKHSLPIQSDLIMKKKLQYFYFFPFYLLI